MLSARTVRLDSDTPYYPAKTPARAKLRNENAYNHGAMTIQIAKTKPALESDIQHHYPTKTPARTKAYSENAYTHGGTTTIQNTKIKATRPLADKTPFANRIFNIYETPGPNQKSIKLTTKTHGPTPEGGSARPSSTRKHSRVPTSVLNTLGSQEALDLDEALPISEAGHPVDDYDEMEYGPPNTLSLPYQPPFDYELPDYATLGKEILHTVSCYPYAGTPPPPSYSFMIGDNDLMSWDTLSLLPLDAKDEPSRPTTRMQSTFKRPTSKPSRPASSQTLTRASSRPATSASTRFPTQKLSSDPTVKPTTRPRSATTLYTNSRTTRTAAIQKQASFLKSNPKPSTRPPLTTAQPTTTTTKSSTATVRSLSRPVSSTSHRPLTTTSTRTRAGTTTSTAPSLTVKPAMPGVTEKKSKFPGGVARPPFSTGVRSTAGVVPNVKMTMGVKRV